MNSIFSRGRIRRRFGRRIVWAASLMLAVVACREQASAQAPANDECAGATALANGVTVTMNTASATSTNDPLTICNASADKGVWFTFTPSTSGVVSVRTCGSNFDTALQVYTSGCDFVTDVDCND